MSPGLESKERKRSPYGGLERAGSILQNRFAEFHDSKRRLRQAQSIQLVRERRETGNQRLGLSSKRGVNEAHSLPSIHWSSR